MVGGSSLPGVGRVLPVFKLAANYTELPGDAPIRRCERQQRDFWAALDDGDLNPRQNTPTCNILKSRDPESRPTANEGFSCCLLYTSPSPRDRQKSRMPSSA